MLQFSSISICGSYVIRKQLQNISKSIKELYEEYFKIKIKNQDKKWVPHKICSTCGGELRKWSQGDTHTFILKLPKVFGTSKPYSI